MPRATRATSCATHATSTRATRATPATCATCPNAQIKSPRADSCARTRISCSSARINAVAISRAPRRPRTAAQRVLRPDPARRARHGRPTMRASPARHSHRRFEAVMKDREDPQIAAACLNAGDSIIDAVSEKTPSGPPRIVAFGAGGAVGGEVVGSGNVLRPCARMHSARLTPCLMSVAETPPGPRYLRQQLLTRVLGRPERGRLCVDSGTR